MLRVTQLELCSGLTCKYHRTQLEDPVLDAAVLANMYTLYGKSALQCFTLADDAELRFEFESSILSRLVAIPNLHKAVLDIREMLDSDSLASQLFPIIPNSHFQPRVTIATRHIAHLVNEAIRKEKNAQFWVLYNFLREHSSTASAAGWLWEAHVITELCRDLGSRVLRGRQLSPKPEDRMASSSSTEDVDILTLPLGGPFSFGAEITFQQKDNQLYAPRALNNPTFDALTYSDGVLTLFKATISPHHSVKASGLDSIWAKLQPNFPQMKTYGSLKWRLVFLVPKEVAPEWRWAQPITTDLGDRAWGKSLMQFVVPLATENLDTQMKR